MLFWRMAEKVERKFAREDLRALKDQERIAVSSAIHRLSLSNIFIIITIARQNPCLFFQFIIDIQVICIFNGWLTHQVPMEKLWCFVMWMMNALQQHKCPFHSNRESYGNAKFPDYFEFLTLLSHYWLSHWLSSFHEFHYEEFFFYSFIHSSGCNRYSLRHHFSRVPSLITMNSSNSLTFLHMLGLFTLDC